MVETVNPIAGALADLGRTFRDINANRLANRRFDLAARQQEGQQQYALEALRIQGEGQQFEHELELARQGAAERQLNRQFGLEERRVNIAQQQADDARTYQEGQLELGRGQLRVSEQRAANERAYQRGQLGIAAGHLAIARSAEDRARKAFTFNQETETINQQLLQNKLKESNLELQEKERLNQFYSTDFTISDISQMLISQGVPRENVNSTIRVIETYKRALAGPGADVSDTINGYDALLIGKAVTDMAKLAATPNADRELLEKTYELTAKIAPKDSSPDEIREIAEEVYLSLKDPQGTEQRFRTNDYNREIRNTESAIAQSMGIPPEQLTDEQLAKVRAQAQQQVHQLRTEKGGFIPQGIQEPSPPATTTEPPPGGAQGRGALAPVVREPPRVPFDPNVQRGPYNPELFFLNR